MAEQQHILWFDALSKSSTPIAGGKGANVAEMTRAGLPVPPGFVVTAASAYGQRVHGRRSSRRAHS